MNIFCSGIGGIGLSAYASLQRAAGHAVSGSDKSDSALLQDLRGQGIGISLVQDGSAIPADCDLLVYSEAIAPDAPERKLAAERGIRSISYFHALGELSKDYFLVAVCGTHGKSSTTAMAAKVLVDLGKDPTVVVGTKVPDLDGKNWRKGKSDLFLVEACEYRRSFHYLSPDVVLMLNVDGDHFDAYGDVDEYQKAFVEFLKRLPDDGTVITHGEDESCMRVARESGKEIVDADAIELPELSVPGLHMRQNARLVVALAEQLGLDAGAAKRSLHGFRGTWRRMEIKGQGPKGSTIVDDYAHHPNEIRASLQAMREKFPAHRIVCVFQPHTHDRTRKLYAEFMEAFGDADVVVIPNIYNARNHIETGEVDVRKFVEDLQRSSGKTILHGTSMDETETLLREELIRDGDLVVCMGAGDITGLATKLVHS